MVYDGLNGNFTINPIQEITFRTGKTARYSWYFPWPAHQPTTIFGFAQLVCVRRPLGLYAFFYASLHFLIFTFVDYGLDFTLLHEAILEKRYALVGMLTFILLAILAATSTQFWMRRLDKRWKRLHWLVYLASPLVVVHYL